MIILNCVYILRTFQCILEFFLRSKVKVKNGNTFFGLINLKYFWGSLILMIFFIYLFIYFFLGGGGGGRG